MKKGFNKNYLILTGISLLVIIGIVYYYFFSSMTGKPEVEYI